jgi:hypothetical protein
LVQQFFFHLGEDDGRLACMTTAAAQLQRQNGRGSQQAGTMKSFVCNLKTTNLVIFTNFRILNFLVIF